jgi:hypothetical protein
VRSQCNGCWNDSKRGTSALIKLLISLIGLKAFAAAILAGGRREGSFIKPNSLGRILYVKNPLILCVVFYILYLYLP